MRSTIPAFLLAAILTGTLTVGASARSTGGNGGDREPAGGAFMSSYPEQGSTGVQFGGPPRAADIPRSNYERYFYYQDPDATGSIAPAPRRHYYR